VLNSRKHEDAVTDISQSSDGKERAQRTLEAFKAKYKVTVTNHYPTRGYDEATAVVEAIRKAGSTDGQKMADALFGKGPNGKGFPINTLSGSQRFTFTCHRPQPANHVIEQYTNGKAKVVATWAVQFVPDIGDGNPCKGKPGG